ncbi:hypothetical protein PR048_003570 [Dryococelus australis]|uniref:Uncharacterized protein n=1 Tax=Dryococelus australis TaxID=614101 RepID=A0ABQ9IPT8_9NEOP|nr:hypothetical protein PR048_003570 [Dryococelus australis]
MAPGREEEQRVAIAPAFFYFHSSCRQFLHPPLIATHTRHASAASSCAISPRLSSHDMFPDLLQCSQLVRHRSGVREALGLNPGQGMGVNSSTKEETGKLRTFGVRIPTRYGVMMPDSAPTPFTTAMSVPA